MNTIYAIQPYYRDGVWAFDDAQRGLVREPFVAGADIVLDLLATTMDRTCPDRLNLLFSDQPFPGSTFCFTRQRRGEHNSGTYYFSPTLDMEFWLCDALLKYYPTAPAKLFVAVKPVQGRQKPGAKTAPGTPK